MLHRILILALSVVAFGCGKKDSKPAEAPQEEKFQPLPSPAPVVVEEEKQQPADWAPGLYRLKDNENVYLRIDNAHNVQTSLELPINAKGSSSKRVVPQFNQALRYDNAGAYYATTGFIDQYEQSDVNNVAMKMSSRNNGNVIDVVITAKIQNANFQRVVAKPVVAQNDYAKDALKGSDDVSYSRKKHRDRDDCEHKHKHKHRHDRCDDDCDRDCDDDCDDDCRDRCDDDCDHDRRDDDCDDDRRDDDCDHDRRDDDCDDDRHDDDCDDDCDDVCVPVPAPCQDNCQPYPMEYIDKEFSYTFIRVSN